VHRSQVSHRRYQDKDSCPMDISHNYKVFRKKKVYRGKSYKQVTGLAVASKRATTLSIQYNDTQYNGLICDTQHNNIECHNDVSSYAESHIFIVVLSVIMLKIIMLSVAMLSGARRLGPYLHTVPLC
jgi:hypothetical protein